MMIWKLAPIEPDDAMSVNGGIAFEDAAFGEQKIVFEAARDAYRAMLSAAPPPPDVVGALEGLLADACSAGEAGPNGSVIVTATAKEWQDHVEATARARSILAQLKGEKP
jgi:hypothetical protein